MTTTLLTRISNYLRLGDNPSPTCPSSGENALFHFDVHISSARKDLEGSISSLEKARAASEASADALTRARESLEKAITDRREAVGRFRDLLNPLESSIVSLDRATDQDSDQDDADQDPDDLASSQLREIYALIEALGGTEMDVCLGRLDTIVARARVECTRAAERNRLAAQYESKIRVEYNMLNEKIRRMETIREDIDHVCGQMEASHEMDLEDENAAAAPAPTEEHH